MSNGDPSERIEPIDYPSAIGYFRAWMDRLLAINRGAFNVSGKIETKYEISHYPAASTNTREVWNVLLNAQDRRCALILATESRPDRTLVEFLDGQAYQRTAYQSRASFGRNMLVGSQEIKYGEPHRASQQFIGEDFLQIAEWIKSELEKELSTTAEETTIARGGSTTSREVPIWWPKQRAKKQRWKALYREIRKLRGQGLNDSGIGEKLKIRRQSVPHIVEWGESSPEAHEK